MAGTAINTWLTKLGAPPARLITLGLMLSTLLAACLLAMALADGKSIALVALVIAGVALSFGLISPNAISEALQPLPEIAGSASAMMAFFQMAGAASSSALVSKFFDDRSALSMAAVMAFFCLLAIASYAGLARPARQDNRRLAAQIAYRNLS
jgi:DHA1 family bicyclomycin/chloramphenicol resistance-like MFS transporter